METGREVTGGAGHTATPLDRLSSGRTYMDITPLVIIPMELISKDIIPRDIFPKDIIPKDITSSGNISFLGKHQTTPGSTEQL